jgi:predicted alpha/beta hydrolase
MTDLQALASDGHRFSVRLLQQEDAQRPLVVICPAMGVQGKYYAQLAQALHAAGMQAATFDLRGQGSSSLRASRTVDWGYDTLLTQDFPALLAAVRAQAPAAPLYFWGHSQGGQLACLFLARQPELANGIILTACGTVYYRGWPFPQRLKLLAQTQLLRSISLALGYLPGEKLGFGGRQARSEIADWADNALLGKYRLRGAKGDDEARLQSLQAPVWAFSLEGDDYAPRASTEHLLGKMGQAPVQHWHMTAADMPATGLHHFYWAKNPAVLVDKVLPLLNARRI